MGCPHSITASAEGREGAAGGIPLFTEETINPALGTLFLLAGMEGSHSPARRGGGGNPTFVNQLAADPKAPGLPWQLLCLPTRQQPPFRQLPKELLPRELPQCSNSQGRGVKRQRQSQRPEYQNK